tara:strand:+ start:1333 stop:3537 length:2205 start_codon:yes stop_codon:yes gene_type:complete
MSDKLKLQRLSYQAKGKTVRQHTIINYLLSTCLILTAIACRQPTTDQNTHDWPIYQGLDTNQYSSLDQINLENVDQLEVAWTYESGGASADGRTQIQCNPIIVDGVLYASSPTLTIFALDASSGQELWRFDPFANGETPNRIGVNRGVTYWSDGDDKRILFTAGAQLFAVNAQTGTLIDSFGVDGIVDIKKGFADREVGDLFVGSNTPGSIFEDLLILPTRVSEGDPSAPGDIRAFNVRTGDIAWTFHTIPRPGQYGDDTWPDDARERLGGANNWAGMTVDARRGLVFVPTGSATADFYGGARLGSNLFANTLLALDARTGERVWHFQGVHHDLFDRDFPAPPNLVTLTRNGEPRDAVVQMTKSAHLFVFDRETGEPLFPIDEYPVEASDIPGEEAWPTQPLPRVPAPFSRQILTVDNITKISPESTRYVREQLERMRTGSAFMPPSLEGTIILPGLDGGGEWGGSAVDPETNIFYANASEMPWVLQLIEIPPGGDGLLATRGNRVYATNCLHCHGIDKQGDTLGVYPALTTLSDQRSESDTRALIVSGSGYMPSHGHLSDDQLDALIAYLYDSDAPDPRATQSTPTSDDPQYVVSGYRRFLDPDGYPAIEPPWGTLTAIDLNRGEHLWQVVHGEFSELTTRGIPKTGTENYGGPVVTAGGLIFIGGTQDERLHAYDKTSGELLWEAPLPAGGYATPATYAVDGRQYVVIAAGGGKMGTPSSDTYVAFALPNTQ